METKLCSFCNKEILSLLFSCKFCGSEFCLDHELPENHNCIGLQRYKESQLESLRSGSPNEPMGYFGERLRKSQLKIFYYLIILLVTIAAIFVTSRILA